MKRTALLFLLLISSLSLAFGQGVAVPPQVALKTVNGVTFPLANATITVCPGNSVGLPCTPATISLFKDIGLSQPISNPFTADSNGNYNFVVNSAAVSGSTLTVTVSGVGYSGYSYQITIPLTAATSQNFSGNNTFTGSNIFSGTLTFTNHNAMYWAGPGATPTIDQAVTSCGVNPCVVEISPLYTGPESANLFTTSIGYKVYNGPNNVTIKDWRANAVFGAPIYSIVYGGRIAGQLNREGVMYYAHSPTDSSTGITSFNYLDGAWPTNNGLQAGNINAITLHDTQIVGSSLTEINAVDGEVHLDATSADNPVFSAFSYGGAVLISRSGVTQNALETSVFRPKSCNNQSPGTATIFYCYGINLDAQTSGSSGGLYRAFSLHSRGDALWENGTKQWSSSADPVANISTATEVNQTATFTMTTNCAANPTLVAGALIGVSGVNVAGYNSQWIINSAGCSGSSFSVFAVGTNNLAAGSGGTVQSTTPRVVTNFRSDNTIIHQPLANALGWRWQTQAAADLLVVNSGVVQFGVNAAPLAAGVQGLGVNSLPWGFLYLGTAATNNFLFNPLATSALRQINIPDPGTNVNMAFVLTATSAAFATATTAGTCVQNTTAVTGAATTMAVSVSPVSTPGVGAQWSGFVSSAGNVTINECAVATSAGGTIAFNIRVFP